MASYDLESKNGMLLLADDGVSLRPGGCCCVDPCSDLCRNETTIEITNVYYQECSEFWDHRYYTANVLASMGKPPESFVLNGSEPQMTCKGERLSYSSNISWSGTTSPGMYEVMGGSSTRYDSGGNCGGVSVITGLHCKSILRSSGYARIYIDGLPSSCSHTHPQLRFKCSVTRGNGVTVNWRLAGENGSGSGEKTVTIDPIASTGVVFEMVVF